MFIFISSVQTVDYGSQFKRLGHITENTENYILIWSLFYFFIVLSMFSSRHTFFLSTLKRNPSVLSSQMSCIICFQCNLFFLVTFSVSAFLFSAKNSYNGYIKSSKFWFPFSILSFLSNLFHMCSLSYHYMFCL